MKRTNIFILLAILLSSIALSGSSETVQTWLAFKASIGAGKSAHSQAVNMGDDSYVVVNRSLKRVCSGDCLASDAVTAPQGTDNFGVTLWFAGTWGACSASTGEGVQTRSVTCVNGIGEPTNGCDESGKPAESKECFGAVAVAAAFDAPASLQAAISATFTSTSTGDVASCAWDFGDGTTANTCTVQHTFASTTARSVTLTITGQGGDISSVSKSITPIFPTELASCQEIKTAFPSLSGQSSYTLKTGGVSWSTTCDMSTANGGWTYVTTSIGSPFENIVFGEARANAVTNASFNANQLARLKLYLSTGYKSKLPNNYLSIGSWAPGKVASASGWLGANFPWVGQVYANSGLNPQRTTSFDLWTFKDWGYRSFAEGVSSSSYVWVSGTGYRTWAYKDNPGQDRALNYSTQAAWDRSRTWLGLYCECVRLDGSVCDGVTYGASIGFDADISTSQYWVR